MQIAALLKGPFEVVNGDYGNGLLAKMFTLEMKRQRDRPRPSEENKYINK